jgi:hypothetical protein
MPNFDAIHYTTDRDYVKQEHRYKGKMGHEINHLTGIADKILYIEDIRRVDSKIRYDPGNGVYYSQPKKRNKKITSCSLFGTHQ